MTEKVARWITLCLIRHGIISWHDEDLYSLGFEVILSTGLTASVILLAGIVLNNLECAVIYLLCFMNIRNYSGGYHASTRLGCFCVSVFCYILSYRMTKLITMMANGQQKTAMIILFFVSLAVFYWKAPVENKNKKLPENWKQRNRKRTFLSVGYWCVIATICYVFKRAVTIQIISTIFLIAILLLMTRRD